MKRILIFIFIIILLILALSFTCNFFNKAKIEKKWKGKVFVKLFPFNKENALDEWQEKIFRGKVLYEIVPRKEKGYLLAKSDASASGIFYKLTFDPRKYPMVSWKWRVNTFPQKAADAKVRDGWIERDDYAARFYVIFPSFYFMNTKCLEYVWDQSLPKGQILTSPYFRNIKLIVAESGTENLGQWVFTERNLQEDFKAAFGRELRQKAGAIAIMTDADNTNSIAEADYSEIKVGYEEDEEK